MRLFRKPIGSAQGAGPTDLDVIRAKLADCEAEIGAAEAALRQAALGAVLNNDETAFEPISRLSELRSRKELLQAALQAAEQVEREAFAALSAREFQARKRALAQHSARLSREASDVGVALRQFGDALERMTATGATMTALLPPSMQTPARPFHQMLSAGYLRDLADLEKWRLSPDPSRKPKLLGAYEDQRTGVIKPLSEIVAGLADRLRHEFDQSGPTVPADFAAKAPLPVSSAAPASSAPVIVDVPSTPAVSGRDSPAPFLSGVLVDLRSGASERLTDLTERVGLPSEAPIAETPKEPKPQDESGQAAEATA